MKAAPILSPEQEKAKALYESTILVAMVVAILLFAVLFDLLDSYLRGLGWVSGSSTGDLGSVGAFIIPAIWCAKWFSRWRVRAAGLSQESEIVETISNEATHSSGEPVEWRYPKSVISKFDSVTAPFGLSALTWYVWHASWASWFLHVECAVIFVVCTASGLVGLWYIGSPLVRIDESGIVSCQNSWWRRRARWHDIARCEIKQVQNFSGQSITRWIIFKDRNERVLLKFNSYRLSGLTTYEWMEIETEIKRRMQGSPVTS